jgi:hypothetical protein
MENTYVYRLDGQTVEPRLADARAIANGRHTANADEFAARVLPIIHKIKA